MPQVSVVIPVYKVEPYIERCLHTLFGQTLEEIEYIFVDDGSPDASVAKIGEVLERYPHRKSQTKLLRHDRNRGVAAARTTGIRAATGEYLIHCDPDDYVEPDMYEKLYAKAKETDADLVVCNHWLNERIVRYDYADTPQACLKNLYKKGAYSIHLVTKLIRRAVLAAHNIVPYEGIDFGEDLNCTVRMFYYARKLAVVDLPLYHYCQREHSLSTSAELVDDFDKRTQLVQTICGFFEQRGEHQYDTFCNYLKFSVKFRFRELFPDSRQWFDWYRECHRDVLKFDESSRKIRIVLWLVLQNYWIYKWTKPFIPGW